MNHTSQSRNKSYSIKNYACSSIDSRNKYIIDIITDNNYNEFERIITRENVDDIINPQNGYCALHYAVVMKRFTIIEILLEKNASLLVKTGNNEDIFDLSSTPYLRSLFLQDGFQRKIKTLTLEVDNLRKYNQNINLKLSSVQRELVEQLKINSLLEEENLKLKNSEENFKLQSEINTQLETSNSKLREDLQKNTQDTKRMIDANLILQTCFDNTIFNLLTSKRDLLQQNKLNRILLLEISRLKQLEFENMMISSLNQNLELTNSNLQKELQTIKSDNVKLKRKHECINES
jgi:hypothetical protein